MPDDAFAHPVWRPHDDAGTLNVALFVALGRGDLQQVDQLMAAGACPSLVSVAGMTPLLLAITKGSAEHIERFLAHGASPDGAELAFVMQQARRPRLDLIDAFARAGHSRDMLHWARLWGDKDAYHHISKNFAADLGDHASPFEACGSASSSSATNGGVGCAPRNALTLMLEPVDTIAAARRIVIDGGYVFDVQELVQYIVAAHGACKNPYTGAFLRHRDVAAILHHPSGLAAHLQETLESNLYQYLGLGLLTRLRRVCWRILQDASAELALAELETFIAGRDLPERSAVERAFFATGDHDGSCRSYFTLRGVLLEFADPASCSRRRLALHTLRVAENLSQALA